MRFVLALVVCAALAGLGWVAARQGTDRPGLRGAPQIERAVDDGARAAIAALGVPGAAGIVVSTEGRDVRLSGTVESLAARDAVLAAVGDTRLLGDLTDAIAVVRRVTPFVFMAERLAPGGITLSGVVPNAAAEATVLTAARTAAAGGGVRAELEIAAGAPPGDWSAIAAGGIAALAPLSAGRFTLSDLSARLTGTAPDPRAGAAALAAAEAVTAAEWSFDIAGLVPVADPYVFSALLTPDGALIVAGHAPDEATRTALMAAAGEIVEAPVEGTLTLAEGMPGPEWPETVRKGLAALGSVEHGLLTMTGRVVVFSAEIAGEEGLARLAPLLDPAWETDITLASVTPVAQMIVTLDAQGRVGLDGTLPVNLTPATVADLLEAAETAGLAIDPDAPEADWTPAIEALRIVLPRLEEARAEIADRSLVLDGRLRRGFSAEGSAAAVRTVMPRAWAVALDLDESAPLAELTLIHLDGTTALGGILPRGLTPGAVRDLLGGAVSDGPGGLVTGGEGDADAWRMTLRGLAEGLEFLREAKVTITEGSVAIDGRLAPGYAANALQDRLARAIAPDWTLGLTADPTPSSEGDVRVSLATGSAERFRSGFWLPEVDFPVSPDRCAAEIDAALAEAEMRFVTGSARIDRAARLLLNRLAAVVVRCVNSSAIRLEIAGHTDSVGNDAANLALSEARAQAVREALVARGVRGGALTARGYGETAPVDSNDTAEGRARNRRIGFTWTSEAD